MVEGTSGCPLRGGTPRAQHNLPPLVSSKAELIKKRQRKVAQRAENPAQRQTASKVGYMNGRQSIWQYSFNAYNRDLLDMKMLPAMQMELIYGPIVTMKNLSQ